jgi:hypothetical protein
MEEYFPSGGEGFSRFPCLSWCQTNRCMGLFLLLAQNNLGHFPLPHSSMKVFLFLKSKIVYRSLKPASQDGPRWRRIDYNNNNRKDATNMEDQTQLQGDPASPTISIMVEVERYCIVDGFTVLDWVDRRSVRQAVCQAIGRAGGQAGSRAFGQLIG